MNCNCVENIKEKLLGLEYKGTAKVIKKVSLLNGALMSPAFNLVTNSDFEVEVEGMKRPQKQSVIHRFCPWCGDKIEKDGQEAATEGKEATNG